MATFDEIAPDEPRRNATLPLLMHSAAASLVTFGTVLVDDADDAERHPHPPDAQAVRADPAVGDLADRIGQRRHFAQAGGHRLDARRREAQAVDDRGRGTGPLGPVDVDGVGVEHIGGPLEQQVGGGVKGGVLGRRGRAGERPDGGLGPRRRGRGSQGRSRPPAYDAGRAGTDRRGTAGDPASCGPMPRVAARRHVGVADHRPPARRPARQRDRRRPGRLLQHRQQRPERHLRARARRRPHRHARAAVHRARRPPRRARRRSAVVSVGTIVLGGFTVVGHACGAAHRAALHVQHAGVGRRRDVPARHDVLRLRLPAADLLLRRHRVGLGAAQRPASLLRRGVGAGGQQRRRHRGPHRRARPRRPVATRHRCWPTATPPCASLLAVSTTAGIVVDGAGARPGPAPRPRAAALEPGLAPSRRPPRDPPVGLDGRLRHRQPGGAVRHDGAGQARLGRGDVVPGGVRAVPDAGRAAGGVDHDDLRARPGPGPRAAQPRACSSVGCRSGCAHWRS